MKREIIILGLILSLAFSLTVQAQEEAESLAAQDENITAQDLGIEEPTVLPGSFFYPFKNFSRGLRSFFASDPVKKAELKLQFANEKLIEAKLLAQKTEKPEILEKALSNYQGELKRVRKAAEKIKEKGTEKVQKFLDKFIDSQIKHQKLIGKFEKEMPQEVLEAATAAKTESGEQLSTIPLGFEAPEQFQERIEKIMEEQSGSKFKQFKNLEVLKEVEEKAPAEAKEAIRKAQENTLKRLHTELRTMGPEKAAAFKEYTKDISGNEVRHLEILEELEEKTMLILPLTPVPKEVLESTQEEIKQAKDETLKRMEDKIQKGEVDFLKPLEKGQSTEDIKVIKELERQLSAPAREKIAPFKARVLERCYGETGETEEAPSTCVIEPPESKTREEGIECEVFITCEEGYIPYDTGEKDSSGCPIKKCIKKEEAEKEEKAEEPGEVVCIALFDPVCGENGKTYSNDCFARVAGVKIAYRGACKATKPTQPEPKPEPQPKPEPEPQPKPEPQPQPQPQPEPQPKPEPKIDTSDLDALLKEVEKAESDAGKSLNDFDSIDESQDNPLVF